MKAAQIFFLSVVFIALAGCGGQYSQEREMASSSVADRQAVHEPIEGNANYQSTGSSEFAIPFQENSVKEAWLGYRVHEYAPTVRHIRELIRDNGGFIALEHEVYEYGTVSNSITIRVPNSHFSMLLDSLQNLAIEPQYRKVRVVDASAKIYELTEYAGLRKEQMHDPDMMAKSLDGKFALDHRERALQAGMLASQRQLSELIETVAFSTITVVVSRIPIVNQYEAPSFWEKLERAVSAGWEGLSNLFLALAYIWPLVLVLVPFMVVGIKRLRHYRHNKKASITPSK